MMAEKKATSKERAAVFLKAAFQALHDAGGSLPLREVKQEVERRVELTPRDREIYEKTGYVRWESVLHFYSIDCVKAGFIRKQVGRWHLTPEGEACLVPESRDATLTREAEEALWLAVFTAAPERRREFEPSSRRRKRRPAPWPNATG